MLTCAIHQPDALDLARLADRPHLRQRLRPRAEERQRPRLRPRHQSRRHPRRRPGSQRGQQSAIHQDERLPVGAVEERDQRRDRRQALLRIVWEEREQLWRVCAAQFVTPALSPPALNGDVRS
jgi:hypothetical protein